MRNSFIRLKGLDLYPEIIENYSIELALASHLFITKIDSRLYAVTKKEHIIDALNYYNKLSRKDIEFALIDENSYEKLYQRYAELNSDKTLSSDIEELDEFEEAINFESFLKTDMDILNVQESAPIIKLVNSLLYQAKKNRASDIHIESFEDRGVVKFRIDGALIKFAEFDRKVADAVISRIKVISNLDISERRVAQDGRTQLKISNTSFDIRVSVLPTYHGERVVLRILMEAEKIPSIKELGFDEEILKSFNRLLKHSNGMILVTGPTGSGKSTTLHSFLQKVATGEKNIITIEDPVEYKSDKFNQIQVNPKAGLTFANGLRAILRQDPDIIMVGEIRDKETAQIAIQAALTGHLLFSTLHTNNAAATIVRLLDMEIEKYLLTSAIRGILSQRLVRKLCEYCKKIDENSDFIKKEYGLKDEATIYKPTGCKKCNYTGYYDRMAIGEIVIFDNEIKSFISEHIDEEKIKEYLKKRGFKSLREKLKDAVEKGITSIEEAVRVGFVEE